MREQIGEPVPYCKFAAMEWILSTLVSTAADELSQHRALKDDIRRLRTTLPKVRTVIDKAECWSWNWKHKNLAVLLTQLKDAAYDADVLLDDFEYQDLQHKIEGVQSQASQTLPSSLSVAINVMSSATNSVRNIARNVMTSAADRVRDVQRRLDHIAAETEAVIRLLHLDDGSKQYGMAVRRETSSFLTEPEVFGREEEREKVIKLLLSGTGSGGVSVPAKRRKVGNVSVLPLVGIGGVGKTTLTQLVYNDRRVNDHFELKMWVCVSDNFDLRRITKEIIESDTVEKQSDSTNLNSLQMILNKKVMSRRFLLVLDDVWAEDSEEWKRLVPPLRCGLQGSMILVTTRSRKVVDLTGTMEAIYLEGLQDDAYRECFKTSAFGFENPKDHPELEAIGKKIAAKLNGSPLAAKTLGGLLNSDMDATHWRTIMNSQTWELPQEEKDILPALRLSYQYLPAHLKQCFSICSIFPKDHKFPKYVLINLWMAHGYITTLPQGTMTLEDIGNSYCNDLISRSFLQQFDRLYGPPYVMHDLIHDLSQFVSQSECFSIENENFQQEITATVRHLAILTKTLEPNKLMEIANFNKLQSLLLVSSFKPDLDPVINLWFNRLSNIRYLRLCSCKVKQLPESIGNLKHLRYLDISYTSIEMLPKALCSLYNLQFLNLRRCPITCFPSGFSNLINLRNLILPYGMKSPKIENIGKLTCLRNLLTFKVLKQRGHMIEELMDMKQLRASLAVINLENVENKEDAGQAKLNNKEYLDELILEWSYRREYCSSSDLDVEGVLEGLQPHPNLKRLELRGYRGCKLPFWAYTQMLPCLTNLTVEDCPQLMVTPLLTSLSSLAVINCPNIKVSFLPPSVSDLMLIHMPWSSLPRMGDDGSQKQCSSSLTGLYIRQCANLKSIGEWLTPHYLNPTIKSIHISDCRELLSLPVDRLKDFISLHKLEIRCCPKLTCPRPREMLLPTSITRLVLDSCGDLDKSLPNCLVSLTALTHLTIRSCPHVASLPPEVMCHLGALSSLDIRDCEGMESLDGIRFLRSLRELDIQKCPKLIESDPLMPDGNVPLLTALTIDNTAIFRLSLFRSLSLSIVGLTVHDSREHVMFTGGEQGEEGLQSLRSLVSLRFACCLSLQSLPEELHSMTSLESLRIDSCPEIMSLPEKGLPQSLRYLYFDRCHPTLTEHLEKHKELMMKQT